MEAVPKVEKPINERPVEDISPMVNVSMDEAIERVCDFMKELLLAKNASYGNSVAEPIKAFSSSEAEERINVRLDDKISRLINGHKYPGDDTEIDIAGYIILKRALKYYRGEAS